MNLLFVRHKRITILDLVDDPILEDVPKNYGHHVDQPLFGHLLQIRLVRQVVDDPWLVQREV